MTALGERDFSLVTKSLDFCQTLARQTKPFNLSFSLAPPSLQTQGGVFEQEAVTCCLCKASQSSSLH